MSGNLDGSQTIEERIEELRAERDKAREECGHQRAMRQAISDEFQGYILRTVATRERLDAARRALVNTGHFTDEEVGDDVAPRIAELAAFLPGDPA